MLKRATEHFAPTVSPIEDKSRRTTFAHHVAHGGNPIWQPGRHLLASDDQTPENRAFAPLLELENGPHDRIFSSYCADKEGIPGPAHLPEVAEREIISASVDRLLKPAGEFRPQRVNLSCVRYPNPHDRVIAKLRM